MSIFYANSAGTLGTGDGSTEANACTLKEFMNLDVGLYEAPVAGAICYLKAGTEIVYDGSVAEYATPTLSGTVLLPVSVISYTTDVNDGGVTTIRDSDLGATHLLFTWAVSYWYMSNFIFDSIRRFDIGATNGSTFQNITIKDGNLGNFICGSATGDCVTYINCVSENSPAEGFQVAHRATRLIDCISKNSTDEGFRVGNASYGAFLSRCLSYGSGSYGFELTGECILDHCLSDGDTGSAYYLDDDCVTTLINCGGTDSGAYGIDGVLGSYVNLVNSGFYGNISGKINATNVTLLSDYSPVITDPSFTDQANNDYSLGSSSPWLDVGEGYGGHWNIGVAQNEQGPTPAEIAEGMWTRAGRALS